MISGVLTGIALYGSAKSGLEIWANTIARGEFSIALAVLYGSPPVAATIAVMVIVTSLVGSFVAKYLRVALTGVRGKKAPSSRAAAAPGACGPLTGSFYQHKPDRVHIGMHDLAVSMFLHGIVARSQPAFFAVAKTSIPADFHAGPDQVHVPALPAQALVHDAF